MFKKVLRTKYFGLASENSMLTKNLVEMLECVCATIANAYLCMQCAFPLSPEQSGKVEYERERLLGIANKFIHLLAIPSSLSRSYSTFPLCSGDNLN
jgi:hypothetical protein